MARRRPSSSWVATLVLVTIAALALLPTASAALFQSHPVLSYCKCICFGNFTVVPLHRPEDPSKPCLSCTRQYCLDQKLPICKGAEAPVLDPNVGTGTEGDVEARCFKRDFPRDQAIVSGFIIVVAALLLFAAVRRRLRRAIEARGQPVSLREWGEVILPQQLQGPILGRLPRAPVMRAGRYEPVSVGN